MKNIDLKEYRRVYYGKNIKPLHRAIKLLYAYNQSDEKYNRGHGDLSAQWIVDNIFTKSCKCGEADWHKLGCNRIDDTKPHTKDNVEPCCMKCNRKRPRLNARKV